MTDDQIREAVAGVLMAGTSHFSDIPDENHMALFWELGNTPRGFCDPLTSLDTCAAAWLKLSEEQKNHVVERLSFGNNDYTRELLNHPDAARILATAIAEEVTLTADRRAERNEIIARAMGWKRTDIGTHRRRMAWIREGERPHEHFPPDYHSLDALAEVLRGMTDEEQADVCVIIGRKSRRPVRDPDPSWNTYYILMLPDPDDLAEAVCAVIGQREE